MTALIILVYGVLVFAGGVIGYVKANSRASLAAGSISGVLLIASAVAMMRGGSYPLGWWLALIVAVLLLARFGLAAMSNFKMMPGGLMIVLSIIAIIALLMGRTPPGA
ncbi:MAG: TMEM14 family protein [Pyrinomonadaceae bacterium]